MRTGQCSCLKAKVSSSFCLCHHFSAKSKGGTIKDACYYSDVQVSTLQIHYVPWCIGAWVVTVCPLSMIFGVTAHHSAGPRGAFLCTYDSNTVDETRLTGCLLNIFTIQDMICRSSVQSWCFRAFLFTIMEMGILAGPMRFKSSHCESQVWYSAGAG